jgi:hypothetical protein
MTLVASRRAISRLARKLLETYYIVSPGKALAKQALEFARNGSRDVELYLYERESQSGPVEGETGASFFVNSGRVLREIFG